MSAERALSISAACGERPLLLVTQDDEGDYIVWDLQRDGCLCHGETLNKAIEHYHEAVAAYDEAVCLQVATPPVLESDGREGQK